MIDQKTALEKKYLEDKVVALKPSPRGSTMGITDAKHAIYFQVDQGTTSFCLPRNSRGDLINVFESTEEREFFEQELGHNLNPSKPGNFFETFQVAITKDSTLMHKGEEFDMKDPMDNLRVRVLRSCPVVSPNWEKRKHRAEYRWAIVDKGLENKEAEVKYDSQKEFWKLMGKYDETPKMRSLLRIYFATIGNKKRVPLDMSRDALMKEINAIEDNEKARDKMLDMYKNDNLDIKTLIIDALSVKAVTKNGDDSYVFTGEETTYTFNDLAKELAELKKTDDNTYLKIIAQVEKARE